MQSCMTASIYYCGGFFGCHFELLKRSCHYGFGTANDKLWCTSPSQWVISATKLIRSMAYANYVVSTKSFC